MRIRVFLFLFLAISMFCTPGARAESTDCTDPVLMIADGRVIQSNFPQNTTYWYGIYAQAGHSYSAEFEPFADNYLNTSKVQFATVYVYAPTDVLQYCRGTTSVAVTQNSGYRPVILKNGFGAGRRVSFSASTAGLYLISATNIAGAGAYSFRAVDTTLFNLRWSTCAGYSDQWGFLNLSDMPVTATFTVYNLNNNQAITSSQFSIPPGGEVMRFSGPGDLNVPANLSGYGIISHNGPPGAILADAYMISSTGALVIYTKFEGDGVP